MDSKKPIMKKYSRWSVAHTILMQVWIIGVVAYALIFGQKMTGALAEMFALVWLILGECFYLGETIFAKSKKLYIDTTKTVYITKMFFSAFLIIPYVLFIYFWNFLSLPVFILAIINYMIVNKK